MPHTTHIPKRRFFIALEVMMPELPPLPKGRILEPLSRHMTLAFIGNIESQKLLDNIDDMPPLPFKVQRIAYLDSLLFLPEKRPGVVAGHFQLLEGPGVTDYQKNLVEWLRELGFTTDERPFLPHMTLARSPFQKNDWEVWFKPTWCLFSNLHLYESHPETKYIPIKTWELMPCFEELSHTADIAFLIRGDEKDSMFLHALVALCEKFPPLAKYHTWGPVREMSFEETISALNEAVTKADSEIGCPFKAVSWHGDFVQRCGIWEWEMIVDV